MTGKGHLWVLSEPGSLVNETEFNEWYDNDHVHVRMTTIPEFLTGSRYKANDGLRPSWLAHYDIASMSLFSDPRYTSLRTNRPPREAELMPRLETLDRRTCRFVEDSPYRHDVVKGEAPAFVVTVNGDRPVPRNALDGVQGLGRAYSCEVVDSLLTGHGREARSGVAPRHVTFFEFDDDAFEKSEALKLLKSTTSAEVRTWKLYRSWPNTAKGS